MDEVKGRPSGISSQRNVFITRTGPNSKPNRNSQVRTSTNFGTNMSPGTFQQLSSTGVIEFKGNRQKEKSELQGLNVRLADYISRVYFLEGQVKKLEYENEALLKRKPADLSAVRAIYENELTQAREVINELTSAKGNYEAKMTSLQGEVDSKGALIMTYINQAKDYKKKIDSLGSQIGEYEGELKSLRLRIDSLEDSNIKIRELLQKVQDQNNNLRADLDAETAAHIDADTLAQSKTEECEFYKDLLDEFQLLKPEPIQIKGMDTSEYWKATMAKAIEEIHQTYEEKVNRMQDDANVKYSSQINSMKNGNIKDGMQLQKSQDECKRLKSQMAEKNSSYADLATKLAALQAQRDNMEGELADAREELERLQIKYDTDTCCLNEELSSVLTELQTLMDAKMSLELEIACYKRLLEGEEARVSMKSLVEDAMGVETKTGVGAALLEAVKQQSS